MADVLIVRTRLDAVEVRELAGLLGTFIKLAVDVRRGIVAAGGEYHADCEEALLGDGSRQDDIWGADWHPESGEVTFGALINIRPSQGNRGLEIADATIRQTAERIVRALMEPLP